MTPLKVAILEVGHGDAIVVHDADTAVVVDCFKAKPVQDYLSQTGIRKVAAIVVTHFHADHFGGVFALLAALKKRQTEAPHFVLRAIPWEMHKKHGLFADDEEGKIYRHLFAHIDAYCPNDQVHAANPGIFPDVGIAWRNQIRLFHPSEKDLNKLYPLGLNNLSVVMRVEGPRSSILLTGDIQCDGFKHCEAGAKKAGQSLVSDFLKLPHHGAWRLLTGGDGDFATILAAVQPYEAVASVGTRQKEYGHPTDAVFNTLKTHGVRVRCTQASAKCLPKGAATEAVSCAGTVVIDLDAGREQLSASTFDAIHRKVIEIRCAGCHRCQLPPAA